jgi:hypothetical protein
MFFLWFLNTNKLVKKLGFALYFQPACLYLEIRGITFTRVEFEFEFIGFVTQITQSQIIISKGQKSINLQKGNNNSLHE